MRRIPKSQYLPCLLLIMGVVFYVYYGITWNAWRVNLPNLIIYILIILALHWALRKKEKYRNNRNEQI